jgi:hypothetical protein
MQRDQSQNARDEKILKNGSKTKSIETTTEHTRKGNKHSHTPTRLTISTLGKRHLTRDTLTIPQRK